MSFIGLDEDLKVTHHHDIYPTIDPKAHYDAQTFSGKVVLITGASRGLGEEVALQYARAGANLTLVARSQAGLEATRDVILRECPSAQVLVFPAEVKDVAKAEEAVATTITDARGWWDVLEVNIRGPFNFIHSSIPELLKTKGRVVVTTSGAAQLRIPNASEYCTSKHAINRFVEFIAIEYPDIKAFSVHPGTIKTAMYDKLGEAEGKFPVSSTVGLYAATVMYLTAGKADYLSGRYVASAWDLSEVERDWKEKIVGQNCLVNKLSVPV